MFIITIAVYYFTSDTTGEKSFEEFYVAGEQVSLERFRELGVIEDVKPLELSVIDDLFRQLEHVLKNPAMEKEDIVRVMRKFIPNFEHIEKGKNLDQKM